MLMQVKEGHKVIQCHEEQKNGDMKSEHVALISLTLVEVRQALWQDDCVSECADTLSSNSVYGGGARHKIWPAQWSNQISLCFMVVYETYTVT